MRTITLGQSSLEVPVIAVGCMRITKLDKPQAEQFVRTALEEGQPSSTMPIFTEAVNARSDLQKPYT